MSKLIKTITLTTALLFSSVQASTVKDVVDNSYKIYSYGKKNGTGSGFISEKLNGYIITNKHVIEDAHVIQVSGLDQKKKYAKTVFISAKYDLAILELEHEKLEKAGIQHCPTSVFPIATPVYNLGNPAGLDFIFTKGYISGIPRKPSSKLNNEFLVHNLIGFSGQSGSALLTSDNCIAGIVTAGYMSAEIGFSIPVKYLEEVISDFLKKKDNLMDLKTIEVSDSSKVTVILSDRTFYNQEENILYLKRTEKNYKLMLTSLIVLLCLLLYRRGKQNEKIK